MRGARLTVGGNAVCARTAFCRPTAVADRAQCDAQVMPRVRRRTPKTAVEITNDMLLLMMMMWPGCRVT